MMLERLGYKAVKQYPLLPLWPLALCKLLPLWNRNCISIKSACSGDTAGNMTAMASVRHVRR